MHDLPGALFRAKDHRNPQSGWGEVLHCANLDLASLYPHGIGKLRSHTLHYGVEASGLAISEIRCGTLYGLSNLLPPTRGGPRGLARLTSSR